MSTKWIVMIKDTDIKTRKTTSFPQNTTTLTTKNKSKILHKKAILHRCCKTVYVYQVFEMSIIRWIIVYVHSSYDSLIRPDIFFYYFFCLQ